MRQGATVPIFACGLYGDCVAETQVRIRFEQSVSLLVQRIVTYKVGSQFAVVTRSRHHHHGSCAGRAFSLLQRTFHRSTAPEPAAAYLFAFARLEPFLGKACRRSSFRSLERNSVVRIASDRQFHGVYGTRSNSLWTFATMRSSIDGANGPGWTMVVK